MIVNDYPDVVVEAQKCLFNVVLTFTDRSGQVDQEFAQTWTNILSVLENQFDCLVIIKIISPVKLFKTIFIYFKDEKIHFIACEGFSKLLIKRCLPENTEKYVARLLITYMTLESGGGGGGGDEHQDLERKKLLSCLATFFRIYIRAGAGRATLTNAFMPAFKYLVAKKTSLPVLRKFAKFFYTLSWRAGARMRQTLMENVLDEITASLDDFYHSQKLVDVLLEFQMHDSDVGNDGSDLEGLERILLQIQRIIVSCVYMNIAIY